jgi:hypothetical protein
MVILATALEAPAVVSGFDDIAVVSEAVQQGRCHFGVGWGGGDECVVAATAVAASSLPSG